MKEVCKLIAQFDSMRTTKDGGGKISFEFGQDSITEIQKLLQWNTEGLQNYAVVITPVIDAESNDYWS